MNAGEMTWMPAPPDLPKGGQMAVLHGDPSKSAPFTVRFKMPSGYKIPPHWHSKDEQLTVISGSFTLHMGDTMDAPATQLAAGGYHFLPGKMHHAAEGKGETIVQIDGMGPFDIHYLNPADNPNPAGEAAEEVTPAVCPYSSSVGSKAPSSRRTSSSRGASGSGSVLSVVPPPPAEA